MKLVKTTAEYTIYQKRNNRYGVKGADKKWVNGEDKVKILLAEDLIKVSEPTAPAEDETEEQVAEESASEAPSADEEPSAKEEPSENEEQEAAEDTKEES